MCSLSEALYFFPRGGLDGKWFAVTHDGKLEEDWKDPEKRKNLKKLGGIMRTPVFVNKGRRVIVPCLLYTSRCV